MSFFSLWPEGETSPVLIASKTRCDNFRRLSPLSRIASRNFFFLASYGSMAAGMSLNAGRGSSAKLLARAACQPAAKRTRRKRARAGMAQTILIASGAGDSLAIRARSRHKIPAAFQRSSKAT